ncbi:uncharacterized membrane protein YkvA (DUF1232 family) [Azospirillum fermentarium]|uniref:YkvA family protein n=1 Tax=Azospirillum fermentarium TaxID=1233114 RepID=UPI002227F853|nr:YkvA family protein [Azospirillum fermentarium]MCW2245087.1 uncharacterized membrane protein YkvA (DUF1232 family) [Azospirillum fermentarium]
METKGEEPDEAAVRRRFWPTLRANLHRVPFARDAVAAYYSLTDPATPVSTRAILAGALAYFVMPVDVIPDALVALGFTDDAAVLMMALNAVRGSLTPGHYERAGAALQTPADAQAEEGPAPDPAPDPGAEPQPSP